MSDKAIWITMETPTEDELRNLTRVLEDTELSERYELIVTSDAIDTISMDELREELADE